MPMKEQQRQVYRSARGKEVDLNKLVAKNELTIAVGNMRVNARGDKIGPGGKIVAVQEELQASGSNVPDQISVAETTAAPVAATPAKKDISKMDPEGNE
jgi:hypothetical protein